MLNARAYDPRRKREPWAPVDDDGGCPKKWILKRMRYVMGTVGEDGAFHPCSGSYYELWKAPPDFDVGTLFAALDATGWGDYVLHVIRIVDGEDELLRHP